MTRSTKTTPRPTDHADLSAWERTAIAEARKDIRLGHCICDEDVDAWLDRFVNGPDPLPVAGKLLKIARD